ncbi:type I toxin-antitoxin system Fst family toxin [Listeria floridensis]|nr:type I toxin-antitoxin system Fst family toxin [Listeria floridensis]
MLKLMFLSVVAPIVVGCTIAYFKYKLEDRRNHKK